jgi:hypothetical protein
MGFAGQGNRIRCRKGSRLKAICGDWSRQVSLFVHSFAAVTDPHSWDMFCSGENTEENTMGLGEKERKRMRER